MSRAAGTEGFVFNHTMIRVKDPKPSLEFYQACRDLYHRIISSDFLSECLGHDIDTQSVVSFGVAEGMCSPWIKFTAMPADSFTLYFLGYDHGGDSVNESHLASREELTHNHGTESDESFQGYASGNTEPGRGFGHIAISVPDIEAACKRFEELGVPFKKRLTDGKMKNIAFILDPDGYWVEALISGTEVAQVNIPALTGDMGILSKHEAIIEELRPGVVEVKTLDGQSKKWFVSGGFATMHPHNELTVNVVEAAPLEDFSPEAVKANLAEANRVANGTGPEKDKAEARVEVGVLEALQYALKA
ncbi:Lactoylglutathione lyase [Serendipita sp. 399]|nr:Lactoylglutathione lyase [Serendipita sp. 399]